MDKIDNLETDMFDLDSPEKLQETLTRLALSSPEQMEDPQLDQYKQELSEQLKQQQMVDDEFRQQQRDLLKQKAALNLSNAISQGGAQMAGREIKVTPNTIDDELRLLSQEKQDKARDLMRLRDDYLNALKAKSSGQADPFNKLAKIAQLKQAKEQADANLALRQESLDQNRQMFDLGLGRKQEEFANKKEQKEQDRVIDFKDKLEKGGFSATNELLTDIVGNIPDKGDVPGFGLLAGSLPGVALSQKGSDLRASVDKLSNITLKDRSGAAVTPPEFKRLQNELRTGALRGDRDLLAGMLNAASAYRARVEGMYKGEKDETIERYGRDMVSDAKMLEDQLKLKMSNRGYELPTSYKKQEPQSKAPSKDPKLEAGISSYMKAMGLSRQDAVKKLKAGGKLPQDY